MRHASTPHHAPGHLPDPRAVPILARTLFRQMRAQGYSSEQIISLSSELIQLVSADLRADDASETQT
jgi:hypothetical protein